MVSQNWYVGLTRIEMLFRGSELRRDIKRHGNIDHVICHPRNRICFLIKGNDVIVHVNTQTYILEPVEVPGDLWRRRLYKVRDDVMRRKITNYEDLLRACGQGVAMIPTILGRYV